MLTNRNLIKLDGPSVYILQVNFRCLLTSDRFRARRQPRLNVGHSVYKPLLTDNINEEPFGINTL